MCNGLSVAYLADQTQASNGSLKCQFRGHKPVWVTPARLSEPNADCASIYNLFQWSYENSSSDKLGIVRQIISLQLGDSDSSRNYGSLLHKANDILGASKSNFRLYLRRSVELYFSKRLEISRYIQKFSDAMGANVSGLTSDLIGNLYRTVGIIIGVIFTGILDPDYTPTVITLVSMLYVVYILFIMVYMLPATFFKYRNKSQDYHHAIAELHDVLSTEEISRLQGNSFSRAKRLFWGYFGATYFIYALLGATALTFFMLFRS